MVRKTKKRSETKKVQKNKTMSPNKNPNHSSQVPKLNRIEGQLAGIKKMIEDRRYCPDIIQQVRATRKALCSIEAALLECHMKQCVSDSIRNGKVKEREQKLVEIMQLFRSATSQGIEL